MIFIFIFIALIEVSYSLTPLQTKLSALLQSNCVTKNGIDLSSLTSNTDYSYSFNNGKNTLQMNVCSDTNTQCVGSASSPIFYSFAPSSHGCFQLGQLNTAVWNGNSVSYSNGDICVASTTGGKYTSTINFVAGATNEIIDVQNNGCDYMITFATNLINNNPPSNSCVSGAGVNFSSLTITEGNDYFYIDGNVNITMNVCANAAISCLGSTSSPIYYTFGSSADACFQLGQLNTGVWNGNMVTYTGGDLCKTSVTYSSSITFNCDKTADTPFIYYVKTTEGCHYSVFLNTVLAC